MDCCTAVIILVVFQKNGVPARVLIGVVWCSRSSDAIYYVVYSHVEFAGKDFCVFDTVIDDGAGGVLRAQPAGS